MGPVFPVALSRIGIKREVEELRALPIFLVVTCLMLVWSWSSCIEVPSIALTLPCFEPFRSVQNLMRSAKRCTVSSRYPS